jgi:hypothetical protein
MLRAHLLLHGVAGKPAIVLPSQCLGIRICSILFGPLVVEIIRLRLIDACRRGCAQIQWPMTEH